MYYIYKIQNIKNNKIYIGLTNNINRRRSRHFTDLLNNRHDNSFLQEEFNIYGRENFTFSMEFKGDVTPEEIGQKEREYIKKYDSYRNGYNQNEGGNFGPSNGGTHLTYSDIYNICAALEFCSRPGEVLAQMFNVSRTTISRIKRGENHCQAIEEYKQMTLEKRKEIYKIFCESSNFDVKKIHQTIIKGKRKLSKEQVFMVLYNYEYKIVPITHMRDIVKVKSTYTLDTIKKGKSYKDYVYEYSQLTEADKQKIASLFSNK